MTDTVSSEKLQDGIVSLFNENKKLKEEIGMIRATLAVNFKGVFIESDCTYKNLLSILDRILAGKGGG